MLDGDMIQDGILGMDFIRRNGFDLIIRENFMKVSGENVAVFTHQAWR